MVMSSSPHEIGRDYGDEVLSPQETRDRRFDKRKFVKTMIDKAEGCTFTKCEFQDCTWVGSVYRVLFTNCCHIRSNFSDTQLTDVAFAYGQMIKASFSSNTVFDNVTLSKVTGLDTSRRLHDVNVAPGDRLALQLQLDVQIQGAPVGWLSRFSSWKMLRGFGKLPFFGFSYTALGGIVTGMFLLSVFNEQVAHWKGLAEATGGTFALLASHLQPIQIPSLYFLLLVSLVLLAVASTIYAFSCPAKIKEFSYDQWIHELRRPAIQYLPLGWQLPIPRVICMVCYCAGAAGAVAVFLVKLYKVGEYIIEHSPMPWWRM
jgi:hypothetical protein